MARIGHSDMHITFTKSFYLYMAFLVLLLPLRILIAYFLSAAVHELFHIISMKIMRVRMYSIRVGIRGTVIEADAMTDKEELLCAIAGPLGGLLLLALFRWFPVLAFTGAVHALYNLLPVYPSDGARILRGITRLTLPSKTGDHISYAVEMGTLSLIVAFCAYGSFVYRLGIVPLMFAAVVLYRASATK